METTKLIDTFPEWYLYNNGAIFTTMKDVPNAVTTFPWLGNAAILDTEYIGNRSGDKTVSPLIDRYIKQNSVLLNPVVLTEAQRTMLANILITKFGNKWKRLYAVEQAVYNPI